MRTHFDRCFDTLETMRCDSIHSRPLDQLEITQSCEVKAQILQRVCGLVHEQNICRRGSNHGVK